MKHIFKITLSLLLACPGLMRADSVELNGFACLFGENLALLAIYQPALTAPIKLTLAEGEYKHGLKLVQVDVAQRRVKIEQSGVTQWITVSGLPDLNAAGSSPLILADGKHSLGEIGQINAWLATGGEQLDHLKSGVNAAGFASGGRSAAATKHPSSAQANQTGDQMGSPANAPGLGGNNGEVKDFTSEAWYQDSLSIEQNRFATAQQVLDGEATPWPRTPLTPANTPAGFIGPETFYPNHIPGYIVKGSVNSAFTGAD